MFKIEKFGVQDKIEIWTVNPDGTFGEKVLETCNNPTIWDRFLKLVGLKRFANDLIMNGGVQDIATFIHDRYDYIQNGTADTSMADATRNDLVSPLATARVTVTKGYETTYVTNDTILFTGVFVNNSGDTQVIKESGLFKDLTTSGTDIMFCRQTFSYTAVNGATYGIIWKVVVTRG